MNYLLLILCTTGITHLLIYSGIFSPPKEYLSNKSKFLKELLNCSMCLSVYAGSFCSIIAYQFDHDKMYIFIPFAGSAVSLAYDYFISLADEVWKFLSNFNKDIKKK